MVLEKRYIPCKCLQKGNEFIPFWELNWTKSEDYGEGFYKDGDTQWDASFLDLQDCYWDSKNKKIITGIIKDVYPDKSKLAHKIDEVVLVEENHTAYRLDKVIDITFEEFETSIIKVKKMEDYELKWYFTEEEIKSLNRNDLYEVRRWKPTYKTENGRSIKWDHQIRKFIQ